MIHNRIIDITEDDLLRLIGQSEDRQMDFKRDLPGNDYDSVKEFLKDVSAMANTIGGDLIYGIEEGVDQNGTTVATQVHGIAAQDANEVRLRLNNIIRDNIKPALVGYEIQDIPLSNGNRVYVVRVPRSWNSPHVVEYRSHWRFYYRSSNSSEMMDITQLRHAMTFANTMGQRLQEFRLDRLAKISADPALNKTAKIVLHFQPFDSLREDYQVDLSKATTNRENTVLLWYEEAIPEARFTFDGLLISQGRNFNEGYIQVFRGGAIEEVDVRMLPRIQNDRKYIPSREFEGRIINAVVRRFQMLRDLEINSPIMLYLTLLGAKDYHMGIQNPLGPPRDLSTLREKADWNSIDRDDLLMRGILVQDFQRFDNSFQQVAQLMQDSFDAIWNAAGFSRSLHYNADGDWTGDIHLKG